MILVLPTFGVVVFVGVGAGAGWKSLGQKLKRREIFLVVYWVLPKLERGHWTRPEWKPKLESGWSW